MVLYTISEGDVTRTEVIVGPMFCGKSEELVRRLVRGRFANKRILLLKPKTDNRPERDIFNLISESKNLKNYEFLTCSLFSSIGELIQLIITNKPQIIAIDEAQFIEQYWIVEAIKELQLLGEDNDYGLKDLKIIVSGLDMDSNGKEFNQVPALMAIADRIDKMTGSCVVCGNDEANMTYRVPGVSQERILVGDKEYQLRCRGCHKLPK